MLDAPAKLTQSFGLYPSVLTPIAAALTCPTICARPTRCMPQSKAPISPSCIDEPKSTSATQSLPAGHGQPQGIGQQASSLRGGWPTGRPGAAPFAGADRRAWLLTMTTAPVLFAGCCACPAIFRKATPGPICFSGTASVIRRRFSGYASSMSTRSSARMSRNLTSASEPTHSGTIITTPGATMRA